MYLNKISQKLDELGMSRKLKGYKFVRMSVSEVIRLDFSVEIECVYLSVAKTFCTNKQNVERNIRYAIEKTWEKGNIENIFNCFGYTIDENRGKPTNREFLFMIADKVMYL